MRSRRDVVTEFGQVFYDHRGYSRMNWRGVPIVQYPQDLLVIADLLYRVRPRVVIETGSYMGGFALFLADHLEAIGDGGQVVSVDVADWSGGGGLPAHERLTFLRGSSTDPGVVRVIADAVERDTCLAVLDSDHSERHVTAELDAYGPLVSIGSYLIVEDTNVHEVMPHYGPGPDDAVRNWLPAHPNFVVDRECERLLLTANPGGYLRRVR